MDRLWKGGRGKFWSRYKRDILVTCVVIGLFQCIGSMAYDRTVNPERVGTIEWEIAEVDVRAYKEYYMMDDAPWSESLMQIGIGFVCWMGVGVMMLEEYNRKTPRKFL